MTTKVFEINPYLSVRWLISNLSPQPFEFSLRTSKTALENESASLIFYIRENEIVHIVPKVSGNQIQKIYIKEPSIRQNRSQHLGEPSKPLEGDQQNSQELSTQRTTTQVEVFNNLDPKMKVQQLLELCSQRFNIPLQHLYLVLGGRILVKEWELGHSGIVNGTYIYALDARKHLRKVPISELKSIEESLGSAPLKPICNKLKSMVPLPIPRASYMAAAKDNEESGPGSDFGDRVMDIQD